MTTKLQSRISISPRGLPVYLIHSRARTSSHRHSRIGHQPHLNSKNALAGKNLITSIAYDFYPEETSYELEKIVSEEMQEHLLASHNGSIGLEMFQFLKMIMHRHFYLDEKKGLLVHHS